MENLQRSYMNSRETVKGLAIDISESERQQLILEMRRWLEYRYTGLWFEKVRVALLYDVESLKEELSKVKSPGP